MRTLRIVGVWSFGLLFLAAGMLHVADPGIVLYLIPESWPSREAMNLLAGVVEMVLGGAFLFPQTRTEAGYFICIMLFVFWVLHAIHLVHPPVAAWPFYGYLLRFLLQPVLIALVWKLKDHSQTVR